MVRGQMKIMQMAFMIIGVFLFFILVGLFFISIQLRGVEGDAEDLARKQTISSIEVVAGMSELNYKDGWPMTLDEDKLRIMSGSAGDDYEKFWPVASIRVYKIYPAFEEEDEKECPGIDCNYYEIYDNGQKNLNTYSGFVSICERVSGGRDDCEVGKLILGVVGKS